jgi:hypothetical protein
MLDTVSYFKAFQVAGGGFMVVCKMDTWSESILIGQWTCENISHNLIDGLAGLTLSFLRITEAFIKYKNLIRE